MSLRSEAEALAAKIDDVYDAGYEKGKAEGGGDYDILTKNGTDLSYAFMYRTDEEIPAIDTNKCEKFDYMFGYCSKTTTFPEKVDASNGTSFYRMFVNCALMTESPRIQNISHEVETMGNMFDGCVKMVSVPELNTGTSKNLSSLFYNCKKLTTIPTINAQKSTIMSYAFNSCEVLLEITLLNTENVSNFNGFCGYCYKLTTINGLDTSGATNLSSMFSGCRAMVTAPDINTEKCTNASYMFSGASKLETIPRLNLSMCSNVSDMFSGCTALKNVTIEGTINCTGLSLSNSTSLTVDSLMSFINALVDNSGTTTTKKITFGSTNLAKLTEEQKAIMDDKGWTYA